jgi:putative transposase
VASRSRGANRHDVKQLEAVLDGIVVKRPKEKEVTQHLCGDKAYRGASALLAITAREYIPHIKQRNEEIQEKKDNPEYQARRWVVEVSHSWFKRVRKIMVRFEKLNGGYDALLHMAPAIIVFRKVNIIYE